MEKENIYKIFFYHQLQNITLTINKIKSLKMVIWIRKKIILNLLNLNLQFFQSKTQYFVYLP